MRKLLPLLRLLPREFLLSFAMRIPFVILAFLLTSSVTKATSYFLSPTGSDANNGTSAGTPWLTPNHAVNCGDVILAAPGSYSYSNFNYNFGTVTCASGNNVAWLKCATFDACKISITSGEVGIAIAQSYWGVQGWEVDGTSSSGGCFFAYPSYGAIHHVIFANDIANVCGLSGFVMSNSGAMGVDYFILLGDIAYNAVGNSSECPSGLNIASGTQSDSLPGTHIYVAGSFSWANVNSNPCAGVVPTDGEGLILDSLSTNSYAAQVVVDNNIFIYNGGRGLMTFSSPYAPVFLRHNTVYGNNTDTNQSRPYACGEIVIYSTTYAQAFNNIAETTAATACGGYTLDAFLVSASTAPDEVWSNVAYSASGSYDGTSGNTGFSYASNPSFGTNPNFFNPTEPGAPSCGSASSVPNCMATVIANFTPTVTAAKAYGYQPVSTTSRYDQLYPQWLCTVTLPTGLVTPGCVTGSFSGPGGTLGAGTQLH